MMERLPILLYRKYETDLFVLAYAGLPLGQMMAAVLHAYTAGERVFFIPKYNTLPMVDLLDHTRQNSEIEFSRQQVKVPGYTTEVGAFLETIQPGFKKQVIVEMLKRALVTDLEDTINIYKGKYQTKENNGESIVTHNYRSAIYVGQRLPSQSHVTTDGAIYLVIDMHYPELWKTDLAMLSRGEFAGVKKRLPVYDGSQAAVPTQTYHTSAESDEPKKTRRVSGAPKKVAPAKRAETKAQPKAAPVRERSRDVDAEDRTSQSKASAEVMQAAPKAQQSVATPEAEPQTRIQENAPVDTNGNHVQKSVPSPAETEDQETKDAAAFFNSFWTDS